MGDRGSTQENVTGYSSENVEGEVSEIQMLTQEAVNKQIRGLFASLTLRPEELTRLIEGVVTTQHPGHYLGLILVPFRVQPNICPTIDYQHGFCFKLLT